MAITSQWKIQTPDSTELYVHEPVLDADGVEIRDGDHGWWFEQPGIEIVVKHIDPDECDQLTVCDVHGRLNTISADDFTHTKPEINTNGFIYPSA